MLCIRDVRLDQGKIVMTMETEDVQDLLYVRFLRQAAEFAETFTYKVAAYSKAAVREAARAELLPAERAERARMLAVFQTLSGSRHERIRTLRELLTAQGIRISVSRIVNDLALATREEREERAGRVRELTAAGLSVREISRKTGIPKATVSRLKNIAPESPRIDDQPRPLPIPLSGALVAVAATCAPFLEVFACH